MSQKQEEGDMRKHDDEDDVIPWSAELPSLVDDGIYDAVVESARRVNRYKRTGVDFRFRILTPGPCFEARLPGFCNLGSDGRVRPTSKLACWMRLVASASGGSPSKVTLKQFRRYWFRVEVTAVKKNSRGDDLSPRDQYSQVRQILEIVGPIDELPQSKRDPKSGSDAPNG
jgi:hypothetical protein